jgi:hypothetical protein
MGGAFLSTKTKRLWVEYPAQRKMKFIGVVAQKTRAAAAR